MSKPDKISKCIRLFNVLHRMSYETLGHYWVRDQINWLDALYMGLMYVVSNLEKRRQLR